MLMTTIMMKNDGEDDDVEVTRYDLLVYARMYKT